MPSWYIKAAAQDLMSLLPASHRWNALFQHHVTRSLSLTELRFRRKVGHAARHVKAHRSLGNAGQPEFSALELGTGWYPVVPVALYLCGAQRVWTVDIRPMLDEQRVLRVAQAYLDCAASGELQEPLPGADPERIANLRALVDGRGECGESSLLSALGVHVLVCDARTTGLQSQSVDLIVSNNTLEHIPPEILRGVFVEFRRLVGASGFMSHSIDLSDHFSNFDHNISPYNFLRFSSRAWRCFNSKLAYQNRLRVSDYRDLHAATRFEIVESTTAADRAASLSEVRIADEFSSYSEDDLAVTSAWFASRPL